MRVKYFIFASILLFSQCQTLSEYRVQGYFLHNDYGFQTTVDSPLVQAYLQTKYAGLEISNGLNSMLASWDNRDLSQSNLKKLSSETSTDFATIYFAKRVMQDAGNFKTQKRFDEILASLKDNEYFRTNVNKNTLFVFVPGLGYKTDKEIGADFGTQRRALQELGIPNTIIEVEEFGRIMTNARIVADNISILSKTYSSIIIVSASKSSSEVAIALGQLLKPEETKSIRAWLSLCGMLRGTPFAGEFKKGFIGFLTEIYLGLKGASNEIVNDMSPEYMNKVFKNLEFPTHIKMIQYIPVALSGQISGRAYSGYVNMKTQGPNDGRTLLADQLIDGGYAVLSFGSDHYFKDKDIKEKSIALGILAQELAESEDYRIQNQVLR